MMEKHKERLINEAENLTTKHSTEVLSAGCLYGYDLFPGEEPPALPRRSVRQVGVASKAVYRGVRPYAIY